MHAIIRLTDGFSSWKGLIIEHDSLRRHMSGAKISLCNNICYTSQVKLQLPAFLN
jgi:hypothetical protein